MVLACATISVRAEMRQRQYETTLMTAPTPPPSMLSTLTTEAKAVARSRAVLIIGVAIVAVFIVLTLRACRSSGNPIPKADAHTIDSLADAKPAFTRTTDSIRTVIVHDTIVTTRTNRVAETLRASAVVEGRRADSLAALAREHADSARLWRAAYEERTTEADTLKAALVAKDSALVATRDALTGMTLLYRADTARRVALEQLNARLANDVKTAGQCRILFLAACPSRVLSFVGGAALAGAAVYVLKP